MAQLRSLLFERPTSTGEPAFRNVLDLARQIEAIGEIHGKSYAGKTDSIRTALNAALRERPTRTLPSSLLYAVQEAVHLRLKDLKECKSLQKEIQEAAQELRPTYVRHSLLDPVAQAARHADTHVICSPFTWHGGIPELERLWRVMFMKFALFQGGNDPWPLGTVSKGKFTLIFSEDRFAVAFWEFLFNQACGNGIAHPVPGGKLTKQMARERISFLNETEHLRVFVVPATEACLVPSYVVDDADVNRARGFFVALEGAAVSGQFSRPFLNYWKKAFLQPFMDGTIRSNPYPFREFEQFLPQA